MGSELEKINLHDPNCVTSILQLLEKHIFHLHESLDNERRRRLVLEAHCEKLELFHKTNQLQETNKHKIKPNKCVRQKFDLYSGGSDDDIVVPAFGDASSLNTALVSYTCSLNEESSIAVKEELGTHVLVMEEKEQHLAQQSTNQINENLTNACSSHRLLKERNYNSTPSVVIDEVKALNTRMVDVEATIPKCLCKKRMSLVKHTRKYDKKKFSDDAKQVSLTQMLSPLKRKDAIGFDQGVTNDLKVQCRTSKRLISKTTSTEYSTTVTPPSKRQVLSQDIFTVPDSCSDDDVNVLLRSPPTADGSLRSILNSPVSPAANECPSVAVVTQESPDIIYVTDTNEECWTTANAKELTGSQNIKLKNNGNHNTLMSKPIDCNAQKSLNIRYSSQSPKNERNTIIFTRPLAEDRDNRTRSSKRNLKEQYNIDCKDCQGYIDLVGNTMTTADIEKLLRNCKRHNTGHMLRQDSPEGFWNPLLLSFPEDDSRNEVLIDNRFMKTNN